MLNPIDTETVICDGGAVGMFPGQIHEGVAWWIGACLVVTQKAPSVVVAHNGHPAIAKFAHRLCEGATNAQHYACTVRSMGCQTKERLLDTLQQLHGVPGAWLVAEETEGVTTVRIQLFDEQGVMLDETNGLVEIRRLIAADRVPIPVNDSSKGVIQPWPYTPTGRDDL
ncbi:hypothetical protein O1Q96_09580 [Streptomyces sp. Qhu-G9]|uniref:hypothetical protein n=1 Tax=Streptomyces sp. Qhu-G9 TaxID=3452799 RepID=UPI0022AC6279|nr:hypothetical protein [Streptomyces aurantiacus]WAU79968.1 hypothetical protein O1Q96_09580 [Streptomyces aurantiacus]